jgi:hypothetical protein
VFEPVTPPSRKGSSRPIVLVRGMRALRIGILRWPANGFG